ncbi:hypothetical protein Hanom_Chr17g01568421 [Helianthus anomalus]
MKENMTRTGGRTTGNKFWMYPLFLQMIMNVQHPNLPKADDDILKTESMIEHSLRIFWGLAIKRYKESEPHRKLFGALDNTNYIAQEDDKCRHNDSQSDNEEPDDGDDEAGDGGDTCAVGASSAGASTAGAAGGTSAGNDEEDIESDDNPPDPR